MAWSQKFRKSEISLDTGREPGLKNFGTGAESESEKVTLATSGTRPSSSSVEPEMSIGLDLDWTGPGLLQILLNLNWIRTVKLRNLGSGTDLDLVNGKKCGIFVVKGLHFSNILDLDFTSKKIFGLCLDLDWVSKIQVWIWIAKYDSPLISVLNMIRFPDRDTAAFCNRTGSGSDWISKKL